MTPTLDTAAIRCRFKQAIIGIRQDGTMAVLVQWHSNMEVYFDLVHGTSHKLDEFLTLIRPGDRVEASDNYQVWFKLVFRGFTGSRDYPFGAGEFMWKHIRPLPAAEPKPEPDMAAILSRLAAAEQERAAIRAEMEGTK